MSTACQFASVDTLTLSFITQFLPNFIYGLISSINCSCLIMGFVRMNHNQDCHQNVFLFHSRALWGALCRCSTVLVIPPANFVCGGYTVFTLSVCASVRPSVTLCFLNIFKSHCWIFIKPCKHVHICKTNTLNKKVRARGQFY